MLTREKKIETVKPAHFGFTVNENSYSGQLFNCFFRILDQITETFIDISNMPNNLIWISWFAIFHRFLHQTVNNSLEETCSYRSNWFFTSVYSYYRVLRNEKKTATRVSQTFQWLLAFTWKKTRIHCFLPIVLHRSDALNIITFYRFIASSLN